MSKKQEIVILSGRSGAGKSTAARALEDLGYFVIDNLPGELIDDLLAHAKSPKIALVVDVRTPGFLKLMPKKWAELDAKKYQKDLIFLDATDKKLMDRYHETRRKHPLDDGCGVAQALVLEQELLAPIREIATKEIFTDKLNSHELRAEITKLMGSGPDQQTLVTIMSFGFKHGVPPELDYCFDVRFLTNPFYDPTLRAKTGLEQPVKTAVLTNPKAQEFLDKTYDLMNFVCTESQAEGRFSLVCAIGCTGGQHRSVALAEALAQKLGEKFSNIRVEHRDVKQR